MKKGDRVYLFSNWDRKGTWAWYEYVVDSAGIKQIHLRSNDGEMLRRRIYPETSEQTLRLVSETPDPEAAAVELARAYIAEQIALYQSRLERPEVFHIPSIENRLAELRGAIPLAIKKRIAG